MCHGRLPEDGQNVRQKHVVELTGNKEVLVQQVGIEICKYIVVTRKMYNIKCVV